MLTMNKAVALPNGRGGIEMVATAKSDFFVDLRTGVAKTDAPFCYQEVAGDFLARARIRPGFRKTYDAGGILVYDSARKWIKLAFELTDLGHSSVVSVVTDGSSDDANGERMDSVQELWLQVLRSGDHWALHHSLDGRKWKMARYFRLKMKPKVKVGIEAQSPLGNGCSVTFDQWKLGPLAVKDMRKGR
jgi:regulation of enolase protein 1 (concanavalin A-like superfamily)